MNHSRLLASLKAVCSLVLATGLACGLARAADAPAPASAPSVTTSASTAPPAAAKPATKPAAVPKGKPGAAVKPDAAAATKQGEHIELDTTQITGNKELPKVMYVVPWKKADMGDFGGRPAKSLLDEVLAPVDRDVFKRQTRYYDALQPDAAAPASADQPAAGNEK
jgi:hypothetical protein